MELKQVILYLASWALTVGAATVSTAPPLEEEPDNEAAETGILNSLASLQPSQPSSNVNTDRDLNAYPYAGPHESLYDTFATPEQTFGISINTRALLAPKVEALRLLEDFFILVSDVISRINRLYNENYELIQAVFNLIVTKLSNMKVFVLKIISALRLFLEFTLNLFSEWSITLPSITLGSRHSMFAPHELYGVPSANTTDFS